MCISENVPRQKFQHAQSPCIRPLIKQILLRRRQKTGIPVLRELKLRAEWWKIVCSFVSKEAVTGENWPTEDKGLVAQENQRVSMSRLSLESPRTVELGRQKLSSFLTHGHIHLAENSENCRSHKLPAQKTHSNFIPGRTFWHKQTRIIKEGFRFFSHNSLEWIW